MNWQRIKELAVNRTTGLLGLTVLAFFLRMYHINFRSIWLDEAYSLRLASSDLHGIISGAIMDIHPPLFHILLAGWIRLFGTSELALRSMSAVCGALLVVVVFRLARSWGQARAAWLSAVLVAISPYFIELSRSGRMAALLTLCSVLSVYYFWKIIDQGDVSSYVGYWISTLAALYTHYFSILPLLAQHLFIFMGIGKLKLSRNIRKHWMFVQMLLLAGYAPWLEALWSHLLKGGPGWRGTGARWFEPLHTVYTFFVGTACWTWWQKAAALFCLLAVLGALVWFGIKNFTRAYALFRPRVWGLLITLVVVPIAAVWIYSLKKINVFDNRYLGVSAAMVLIICGGLLSQWPPWRRRLGMALFMLAFSIPLANQYFVYGYYDNWRAVAQRLTQTSDVDHKIAVYPAWNQTPLNYYLRDTLPIQGIPGDYHPLTGVTENYFHIDRDTIGQLESSFSTQTAWWLILVNQGQEQDLVKGWFDSRFKQKQVEHLGAITMVEYTRKREP